MIRNIKETFSPKTGLREKTTLARSRYVNPGYVEDVEDTLLNAAWSVQVIRIILKIRFIIFQLNLSNVEDIEDCKTDDNKLHCIILSLLYLISKMSEMHTNVYELQCGF